MQLECTQTMIENLNPFAESIPREINPYLCWSVESFLLEGKPSLIVMNKACHSAFLLFGITDDSREFTEQLILDGIKRLLRNYGVGARFIEQYLEDAKQEIFWTTLSDPDTQLYLQRLIADINRYTLYLTSSTPYQDSFTDWAALQTFKGRTPVTCLVDWINDYYKNRAIPCRDMALIKIRLRTTDCVRTLRVPCDLSLYDFHQIIQSSFSWRNYHMHCFYSESQSSLTELFSKYNTPIRDPYYEEWQIQVENNLTVRDLFQKTAKSFYLYDYGENWIHELELLRVETCSRVPVCSCILAAEDAPPEDVKGVGGYDLFSEVMGNLIHPAHLYFLVWSVQHGWKPLNMAEINEKLFAY